MQNNISPSVIEVIEQPVRTLNFKYQCEGPIKSNGHKSEKKFISLRVSKLKFIIFFIFIKIV